MAFVPNTGSPAWAVGLGLFVLAAVVVVVLTLRFVAVRMTRAWHEEPPRPEVVALQRKLTTPVLFPQWLRGRQRQRLTKNPLLWLQHRTVAAALTRWGWLAVLLGVWLVSLSDSSFFLGTRAAPLVLLGGMAFSAAGGFRAERESGTLELLLVTPLTPGQLMQSRAQAHVREFLLPVALQLFLVAYVSGQLTRDGLDLPHWNWWLVSSLVAMPWIGLWRGLRARNFVTAVLSTAFWSLLVPALVTVILQAFYNPLFFETPARIGSAGFRFFLATRLDWGGLPALFQIGVGIFAALAVWRELTTRQFALAAVGRA